MIRPTPETVRAALFSLSPDMPRDEWVKVGMAVKDALNGEGFDLFDAFSQGGQSYNATDCRDTWKSIRADGGITVGTLFDMAKRAGWKPGADAREETEAERQERERKQQEDRRKTEQQTERDRERAAAWAAALWKEATPARPDHPYLARKGIAPVPTLREIHVEQAAGILGYHPKSKDAGPLAGRVIVAPVKSGDRFTTAELIDEQGRKSALAGSGTKPAGCHWTTGELPEGDGTGFTLAIGEGVATVLSIHQGAGHTTIAALSAGNLPKVAKAMRERYPAARLLILADIGNGQKDAERAARETGAALAVPDFTGLDATEDDTDFNDLHRLAGLDAVRGQIAAALLALESKAPLGNSGELFPPKPKRRKKRDRPTNPDDTRPAIKIIGGTLPEQIEAAEAALIASGTEVYQRNGEIVRPIRLSSGIDEKGVFIPSGAMVLGITDKHWMLKAMTRVARFEKYNSRSDEWNSTDCPMKVAESYLSSAGEWKIPPIIGISECPTMRRDGSVILKSGYDRLSGIFVDYHGPEVSIIENPTRQDALEALEILKKPFCEFPFTDDASHSVALSGALTSTIRRSLRTAPMHAFDAPTKGSGKGLLADTISMIATGRTAAMVSQGRDEAEDEKRLSSMLMRSAPVICIDNIERSVQGDFLCTMLTQEIVSPRILGFSKMVDLPSNSLILATGNNMVFVGDMTRRVLPCRIDPECERPDARRFAVNLREWVPANRHRLIGAALTILRAYHVAGRPAQNILPYGSFEAWSDLVRSALVWLGCADPCLTRESLEKNDPVTAALSVVLPLWHGAFGQDGKTTAEVVEACNLSAHADLKHALLEVAASTRNPELIDAARLGRWLKKYEKRVESGLRIEKTGEDSHAKIAYWRVSQIVKNAGDAGNAGDVPHLRGNFGNNGASVDDDGINAPKKYVGLDISPASPASPANNREAF